MRKAVLLTGVVMGVVFLSSSPVKAQVKIQEGKWKITTVNKMEGLPPEAEAMMKRMKSSGRQDADTGLTQVSMDGLPPEAIAAMKQAQARGGMPSQIQGELPPEAMAAMNADGMPPEAMAMMKQMMANRQQNPSLPTMSSSGTVTTSYQTGSEGGHGDSSWQMNGDTMTMTKCVTAEDQMNILPKSSECTMSQGWVGNVFSFNGTCAKGSTVSGRFTYSGGAMEGAVTSKAEGVTINSTIKGEYIGPCDL